MTNPLRKIASLLVVLSIACTGAPLSWAQETPAEPARTTATVEGRIFGPDRVTPIPGAVVRAVRGDGVQVYSSAPADERGNYTLQHLAPGSYDIVVELADSQHHRAEGLLPVAGHRARRERRENGAGRKQAGEGICLDVGRKGTEGCRFLADPGWHRPHRGGRRWRSSGPRRRWKRPQGEQQHPVIPLRHSSPSSTFQITRPEGPSFRGERISSAGEGLCGIVLRRSGCGPPPVIPSKS